MMTFTPSSLLTFLKSKPSTSEDSKLVIVGLIKDANRSCVEFSGDNLATWLRLPTALIEEATYLGNVPNPDNNKKEHFPLFSISLKTPTTQSERFLFDLIIPPFFMAARNRNKTVSLH